MTHTLSTGTSKGRIFTYYTNAGHLFYMIKCRKRPSVLKQEMTLYKLDFIVYIDV